jgi:glutathione S-transferase
VANIKLYGYSTSPYVRKVGCCLYYKKLPFEFVPVNPIDPREIGFSGQAQVPVLQIGDEWRTDSTPLAIWLDELFPEKPLLGNTQQESESILALDSWVTDSLILSFFRYANEGEMNAKFRHSAWRLAAIVSSQTPLSAEIRNAWPDLVKMAPFIKHMMCDVDTSETLSEMQARVPLQLIENLQGGPFFGGRKEPSLVDFAIFPQVVFTYMVGIHQNLMLTHEPSLNNWLNNIKPFMPKNPLLVPDFMIVNELP